jgi:hypothetical protein
LTKYAKITPKISPTLELQYWEYREGEVLKQYKPGEIFMMSYVHPASPFQGMSALMAQTYPYDIDLFLMQQQRALFEHGAMPGLHLSTEQGLTGDQVKELREQIDEQYSGAVKSGETLITHSGLKAERLGWTGRESMINVVGEWARDKLITAFDETPGTLGLIQDVNRSNGEFLNELFIQQCLRPRCMMVEEEFETFFLPIYDQGLTCDFDLPYSGDKEFELRDRESRLTQYLTTINEERERLGKKPVAWGDIPWMPFTLAQAGSVSPGNGDGKSHFYKAHKPMKLMDRNFWTEGRKDIHWKLFIRRSEKLEQIFLTPMRQHFKQVANSVLTRLDREGKKILGQYAGWSRQKVEQHIKENKSKIDDINIDKKVEEERLKTIFESVVKIIMKDIGDARIRDLMMTVKAVAIDFNVNDPTVLKWLDSRMRKFSKEVTGTTFDQIEAILRVGFSEGQPLTTIAETLREKFESWDKYRAPAIARTETLSAMNEADRQSVIQSGLDEQLLKHWLSARDGVPPCRQTHADADEKYIGGIPIDEEFEVGADHMQAPGGGQLAEENINCLLSHRTPILTEQGFKHIDKIEIGDMVLTHNGRFRKVLSTLEPKKYKGETITLRFEGNYVRLTVTPEHRFLVGKKWKRADEITVGQSLSILSSNCSRCGKIIPYYRKVCSLNCNSKNITDRQWSDPEHKKNISLKASKQMKREFDEGIRDREKITEKAQKVCFERYGKGGYLAQKRNDPEFLRKIEEGIIRNWGSRRNMLCKTALKAMGHISRKGSKLEDRMVSFLNVKQIQYVRQYSVENLLVDFYVPEWKNFIEVDGKFFPQDAEKERKRDLRILLKYPDHKISHVTYGPEPKWKHFDLMSLNHERAYGFVDIKVIKVEKRQLRIPRKLYNLAVEEDESYVSKGLISHNCRCGMYYSQVGSED